MYALENVNDSGRPLKPRHSSVTAVHEASFITFMFTSEVYMLCSCILYKWSRKHGSMSPLVCSVLAVHCQTRSEE